MRKGRRTRERDGRERKKWTKSMTEMGGREHEKGKKSMKKYGRTTIREKQGSICEKGRRA